MSKCPAKVKAIPRVFIQTEINGNKKQRRRISLNRGILEEIDTKDYNEYITTTAIGFWQCVTPKKTFNVDHSFTKSFICL